MRQERVDFLLYGKIGRARFARFFFSLALGYMLIFMLAFPPIMTRLD